MRRLSFILMVLLGMLYPMLAYAENLPGIDPQTMALMENQQQQNQNLPAEILALMPPELLVTTKTWMVEPTYKMLLSANLESVMNNTRLENSEGYQLICRVSFTSYNLNSPLGQQLAAQNLELMRQKAQVSWLESHPASSQRYWQIYQPEKIVVNKGFIMTQQSYSAAHIEGEGLVPERRSYTGFLYLEIPAGFLTAEIQTVPNTKAGIEKWLRYVASGATKLELGKYF